MKNYSKQREEIINTLKDLYNHPTAEEVYILVKGKDPFVSRSTVYRNLGLLVNNKIIEKISVFDGPDRYDYIRKPHHHIICTSCGNVFDFEYKLDYKTIKSEVKKQTGVDIINKGTVFQGTCRKCKNN